MVISFRKIKMRVIKIIVVSFYGCFSFGDIRSHNILDFISDFLFYGINCNWNKSIFYEFCSSGFFEGY